MARSPVFYTVDMPAVQIRESGAMSGMFYQKITTPVTIIENG